MPNQGMPPRRQKELEGRLWRIESITFGGAARRRLDDDIYPAADDGSDAYVTFENGEIGGSLGCGQLMGRYNLSNDEIEIGALSSSDERRCGPEFFERTHEVISAFMRAVRVEQGGQNAFNLFDEKRNYVIRLELLAPGFDLSEFRGIFWRVISLEGNPISEPDVEVRIDRGTIAVSVAKSFSKHSFRYGLKKLSFGEAFSRRSLARGIIPPLFEIWGRALQRITKYAASGDDLSAQDESGQQVVLLRRISPAGLEYRYWRLAAYGVDGWLNPIIGFPQFRVVTFVRGELRGSAGCRGFHGDYSLAGDNLSAHADSNGGSGSCSVVDQNQERIVLYAFGKASLVKDDGARVLLQDAQGNTNIVLEPYAQQTLPRSAPSERP